VFQGEGKPLYMGVGSRFVYSRGIPLRVPWLLSTILKLVPMGSRAVPWSLSPSAREAGNVAPELTVISLC
jgi:hypothetical protein